ncbi:MAG TPA: hypothetical protein PKA20_29630 [Burkholderiaceae bacterium]|nr:hypothetical protein [Burkholderiaceae bacterium]
MTMHQPHPREIAQLHALRELRVRRARSEAAAAEAAIQAAARAVQERQGLIRAGEQAIDDLAEAVTTRLAADLPRWNDVASAERARLAECVERDVDALIGEENRLEAAEADAAETRAALARAIAREDVMRDLARQARRAHRAAFEQRAEVELEDQGRGVRGGAIR